jgi:hypothetical protein
LIFSMSIFEEIQSKLVNFGRFLSEIRPFLIKIR